MRTRVSDENRRGFEDLLRLEACLLFKLADGRMLSCLAVINEAYGQRSSLKHL